MENENEKEVQVKTEKQFNVMLEVTFIDKIREYAENAKMSQRDLIEIAVRDFLRKRGAL